MQAHTAWDSEIESLTSLIKLHQKERRSAPCGQIGAATQPPVLATSPTLGSKEEKTCRISDKDEKLARDVSPSQGRLQTEDAPERAKRLSPISCLCLIFTNFEKVLSCTSGNSKLDELARAAMTGRVLIAIFYHFLISVFFCFIGSFAQP